MKRIFTLSFKIFFILIVIGSLFMGGLAGYLSSDALKIQNIDKYWDKEIAIPSVVYDVKGRVVTEFFAQEKRDLIKLQDLPKHVIYTLITREDKNFYNHIGFDLKGFFRGVYGVILGINAGGGSTITQQLVGQLGFVDRSKRSLLRKLKEIWYAIELEKIKSKDEILEKYLNSVYFGHNTYGIEAASQFYFGHSAKDMTVAETAILVIQLSNPTKYSPIKHPNVAKDRQEFVLDNTVKLGYLSKNVAEESFKEFWQNYDYTRASSSSAFFDREDKAPYYSEYIRNTLQNGSLSQELDINRDGFSIYASIDLELQQKAKKYLAEGLKEANSKYEKDNKEREDYANKYLIPILNMLSLTNNMAGIELKGGINTKYAKDYYFNEITPVIDILGLMFGISNKDGLRKSLNPSYKWRLNEAHKNEVEGALVTIDNQTGHLVAMVGGSKFEYSNQFNRALNARIQPGSIFKPLYFAAALDKKVITPATVLNDGTSIFTYSDGRPPYTPINYGNKWNGDIRLRPALARSLNIPAIKVLEKLGFKDGINYTAKLLGITEDQYEQRGFDPVYPFALGTISVSPVEMAKAYSTLANLGKEVDPILIRYIKDRDNMLIIEPEKNIQENLLLKGKKAQIISEQAAYVITNMLKSTLIEGTLAGVVRRIGGFGSMPVVGKSGTSQNWSDLWAAGYSSYYTTVVWIGFDKSGKSLGRNQTGTSLAGPVWANYMKDIHKGLKTKKLPEPKSGIIWKRVDKETGLLAYKENKDAYYEVFIKGTEPVEYADKEKALDDFLIKQDNNNLFYSYDFKQLNINDNNKEVFEKLNSIDNNDNVNDTIKYLDNIISSDEELDFSNIIENNDNNTFDNIQTKELKKDSKDIKIPQDEKTLENNEEDSKEDELDFNNLENQDENETKENEDDDVLDFSILEN